MDSWTDGWWVIAPFSNPPFGSWRQKLWKPTQSCLLQMQNVRSFPLLCFLSLRSYSPPRHPNKVSRPLCSTLSWSQLYVFWQHREAKLLVLGSTSLYSRTMTQTAIQKLRLQFHLTGLGNHWETPCLCEAQHGLGTWENKGNSEFQKLNDFDSKNISSFLFKLW